MTTNMNIQVWEKHVPRRRRNQPKTNPLYKRTDQYGRRHWIKTVQGLFVMHTEFDPGYPEHSALLFTGDLTKAQQAADRHIRAMEEQGPS